MKTPRVSLLSALLLLSVSTLVYGEGDAEMDRFLAWLKNHPGATWTGQMELWIDPTGNAATISNATLTAGTSEVTYTWYFESEAQQGRLRWQNGALTWSDTWHQSESRVLSLVRGHGSLLAAEYAYPVEGSPDWQWRIKFSERPDGTPVLQMTNITPWGEEGRAARAVFTEYER